MDCELIGWCALKPEVQAAWVQAVGSVLALALGLGVPYWQRQSEVKDRRIQEALLARSFGTRLLREFVKFRDRIARDLKAAESAGPGEIVKIEKNTIPQAIWDNTERLHILGLAGHHVLLAMNAVRLARKELDSKYHALSPTNNAPVRFVQQMQIAQSECDEAVAFLERSLNL